MAVGFNSSGDGLSRTTNLPTAATAWTACGWVRRDGDANGYGAILWLTNTSGVAFSGVAFNTDGTTLSVFGTNTESNIPSGGQPDLGEWVFVAVTQNGTTVTGYASPEGDSTFYSNTATSTNFSVERFSAGNDMGSYIIGAMQNIRVFNSVLNQAALELEKAATAAVATELFDWRCNDNTDTNDISGNGRNPTVSGTLSNETGPASLGGGGGTTATALPITGSVTASGRNALVNAFNSISLRGTFINEAGSPVANATGINCLVWYNTAPAGAPDESLSSLTTNANGSYSFALALGGLVFGEQVYRVIYQNDPPTRNHAGVRTPSYE